MCTQLGPFLKILAYAVNLIRWIIPILLIILITFDLVKATIANDDKMVEEAKKTSTRRIIYAIVIFLIPTIIIMIFRLIGNNFRGDDLTNIQEWISCFNTYF